MEKMKETMDQKMKWYQYVAIFFAGIFLTNAVPHFVNGISGNAFPTPFANPPAKGLSSPLINILWAFFNLIIGYFLFKSSKINSRNKLALFIFFVAILFVSIMLSITFMDKLKS